MLEFISWKRSTKVGATKWVIVNETPRIKQPHRLHSGGNTKSMQRGTRERAHFHLKVNEIPLARSSLAFGLKSEGIDMVVHGNLIRCCMTKPTPIFFSPTHLARVPYMTIFLAPYTTPPLRGLRFVMFWGFCLCILSHLESGESWCHSLSLCHFGWFAHPGYRARGGLQHLWQGGGWNPPLAEGFDPEPGSPWFILGGVPRTKLAPSPFWITSSRFWPAAEISVAGDSPMLVPW
jgi:hypothetical protein